MVKKKKSSKKSGPKLRPKPDAAPNLFERLSNKKRFDVLGRNIKGETRHVGKLRTAATEKRKSTLLVEYTQLRKTNAFIDRRFGEDDESLTQDERAILRFQKQRLREMAGGKFSLPDDGAEEEPLTHLGRSLAEVHGAEEAWASDEDDAGLDAALTRDLHFGGGLFEKKHLSAEAAAAAEGDASPAPHRTKKEVMAEVMAKSKAYKAERQQQREEDLVATEALDEAWKALSQAPALLGMLRPKGEKLPPPPAGAAAQEDRKFDALARELAFEARAQPGERTLGVDELAEMERQRLQALEAQRVKRQRGGPGGGDDLGDDFGGDEGDFEAGQEGELPVGGYARRRAKMARIAAARAARKGSDDESGSDSGSDDESGSEGEESDSEKEGLTKLEQRRQAAAAGDHPLQHSFRDAAAQLLSKYNPAAAAKQAEQRQQQEQDDSSDGDGGSESESGEDEEEEEEEKEEKEASEGGGTGSSSDEQGATDGSSSEDEEGEGEEEQEAVMVPAKAKTSKATDADPPTAAPAPASHLSFTPPLPETYAQFAEMATGLSPQDLGELLRRVRAFNASALNSEGRKRLQVLYGVITQHFVTLATASPLPLAHLDALLLHLLELTPQLPFYAATLARARLSRAQQRLAQALRDPLLRTSAWPSPSTLLLLRLLAVLFPPSDKRHPVLTPASLLACAALAQCPVARPRDVATGLFLANLALDLHSEAKRFVPEPLAFAVSLLRLVLPAAEGAVDAEGPRWLCVAGSEEALAGSPEEIAPLRLGCVVGGESSLPGGAEYFTSAAFKTSAAAGAVLLVRRAVGVFADIDALPEVMGPVQEALRGIVAAHAPTVAANGVNGAATANGSSKSKRAKKGKSAATAQAGGVVASGLALLTSQVLAEVDAACAAAIARRRPLCLAKMVSLPEPRQFNPRFEEGFASGKDYDPDQTRAERRRLQRALRQEERGAMRELRRDAAFMAAVRDKDKASTQASLDASARRAMAFLQQQEGDFKSGGQGGMWKGKKRK